MPWHQYLSDYEDEDHPSCPMNLVLSVDHRADIFQIESHRSFIANLFFSLTIGIICAFWFRSFEFVHISRNFLIHPETKQVVKIIKEVPRARPEKRDIKRADAKELDARRRRLRTKNVKGSGKGNLRERISGVGILAILEGRKKSLAIVGEDVIQDGFADDLDEVLAGIATLEKAGPSRRGRPGIEQIQYNEAYTGGRPEGSGGIDDIMASLFQVANPIPLRGRSARIQVKVPGAALTAIPAMGGRTRQSIVSVVMQHLRGLRYIYNKRLKAKPGLSGKITVRFSISPEGRIVSCKMIGSTINDPVLEKEVLRQVLRWRFDPVDGKEPTVVQYPFAFSQ